MKYSAFFALILTFSLGQIASAQLPECMESAKPLYKDIQIYRATEAVKPNHGVIGARLQYDLSTLGGTTDVQLLESGFAKCDVILTQEEQMQLDQAIQAAKAEVLR